MKKILVPIDGSAESIKAATRAVEIARQYGSEVTFLAVVEVNGFDTNDITGAEIESSFFSALETLQRAKMLQHSLMLDALVNKLDCTGLNSEKKVILGSPHPKIVETARNGHYDLIIMGHRGHNPVSRIFLGSVAKRVIEDAPCPVMIVK